MGLEVSRREKLWRGFSEGLNAEQLKEDYMIDSNWGILLLISFYNNARLYYEWGILLKILPSLSHLILEQWFKVEKTIPVLKMSKVNLRERRQMDYQSWID